MLFNPDNGNCLGFRNLEGKKNQFYKDKSHPEGTQIKKYKCKINFLSSWLFEKWQSKVLKINQKLLKTNP